MPAGGMQDGVRGQLRGHDHRIACSRVVARLAAARPGTAIDFRPPDPRPQRLRVNIQLPARPRELAPALPVPVAFAPVSCLAMSWAVNNALMVVAVAPARRMPWKATANDDEFGARRPTTSPAPAPRAASAPAVAFTLSISSR